MKTVLENLIKEKIKGNSNQEITGQSLQDVLLSIVDSVYGDLEISMEGYSFEGIATVATVPPTLASDADKKFYLAVDDGLYSNFKGLQSTPIIELSIIRSLNRNYWEAVSLKVPLNFEIKNELGTSQKDPMSQKKVTELYNQGYKYAGIAHTNDKVTTLTGDEKVFYIVAEEGEYTNFGLGNISELSVIKSSNGRWSAEGLGVPMDVADNIKLFTGESPIPYDKYIEELYLFKFPDNRFLDIRRGNGATIIAVPNPADPANNMQIRIRDADAPNNLEAYPLTVQVAPLEGYSRNEVVGYIVYKDIEGLISEGTNFTGNNGAYTVYVKSLKNFPIIQAYLSSITDLQNDITDLQNDITGLQNDITDISGLRLSASFNFPSAYYAQQLPFTIKKGSFITLSGDVTGITCRTNKDDTEYQDIVGSGIADRDINWIKNRQVGALTIEVYAPGRMDSLEEQVDSLSAMVSNKLNVHLPSDIYIIKDKKSQFFYRGFIESVDPYIYDIKVKCAIGKTFRRYYEITPAQIGDYPFTIEVRDNNRNILATASSTIHVIDKTSIPSNKNVLCVGASATATGHWPSEIKRMSENMSLNLNYVGRLVGSADNSVNLEAMGGWTWGTFIHSGVTCIRFFISGGSGDLTINSELFVGDMIYTVLEVNLTEGVGNIMCAGKTQTTNASEPSSPQGVLQAEGVSYNYTSFVKESFVPFPNGDFTEYADTYCNGRIDIMMIHMGVNSMLKEHSAIPENDIKDFLDGYFNSFPDSKVLFAAIPMPDYGTNVYSNTNTDNNINRYGTLHSFMEYNDYMYHLSQEEYNGKLLYCPGNIFFDTDYGYPKMQKSVNSRISSIKESVDTNGVHPIAEGSYLIADSILPVLIKMLEP